MRDLTCIACFLLFLLPSRLYPQKYKGEFAETEFNLSAKRLNFFADMFETHKQLTDFMDIHTGDVIAEVGADDGWNLGVLSVIYDSLILYAQDIDAKALTQKSLDRTISYYEKQRNTKQTNTFKWVIGTVSATNLPEGIFDKILLIDAYHDFDKKDEMIDDISHKLKPGGKIYILDGFSFPNDTQVCPDHGKHVLTTLPTEVRRFEKHGFYLTKMRSPDYKVHYGNGLVFERNKIKSDEFYRKKESIDNLVERSSRLRQSNLATDSEALQMHTDSLLPKIQEIANVYSEYEVWIKDIGVRYLKRGEFHAAINIFKVNTRLFPDSYQAWYWLALAYQENKQERMAIQNFKTANRLNPSLSKKREALK
jgi:tetratricopeptide (TPR) repeat protein